MNGVAVIGGGAAGLAAAVMLRKRAPALPVTVFEQADRVGRKLAVTGNGTCNITNQNAAARHYHGDAPLAERLLRQFDYPQQKRFFEELGVLFAEEPGGRVYPLSRSAASVTDALRFAAAELGTVLRTAAPVTAIRRAPGGLLVTASGQTALYQAVLVAAGGAAGGKLGGSAGYALLKALGHKIEPVFPAIVQLKTDPASVSALKGVKVEGAITLTSAAGSRTERGEILFCSYGLSGPPVLQVSRLAAGANPVAELDLMPGLTEEAVHAHLARMAAAYPARPAGELCAGFLNKRLGQVALKRGGAALSAPASALSDEALRAAAALLKRFTLPVTGTTGLENAQVTAGGAQTAQFFDYLMSKKVKGLFAAGEVLNIDGDCGGYNLAWCWASAHAAAEGIITYCNSL